MSVDILMATFNGAKHIRNQILSLQQQTYEDWILWVRDDGSTDNTIEIVKDFSTRDSRIKIIDNSENINLGPGKSFLLLSANSTAEYAVFCDQDDIWFEKKLEILLSHAEKNFKLNVPSLVYCDGYGYSDVDGVININSISNLHAKSINEFLFFNSGYQGCSMLFNKVLCKMFASYRADYFYMHDDIVALLAHSFGDVYFLPKSLMLYRQHEKNVTSNISFGFKEYINRVFDIKRPVISIVHYREKYAFYEVYKNDLSATARKYFTEYLRYPESNKLLRILIIFKNNFSLGGNFIALLVKTIIRKPLA
jgi:glycosyltransferase involved in cell wall biosynthesis